MDAIAGTRTTDQNTVDRKQKLSQYLANSFSSNLNRPIFKQLELITLLVMKK